MEVKFNRIEKVVFSTKCKHLDCTFNAKTNFKYSTITRDIDNTISVDEIVEASIQQFENTLAEILASERQYIKSLIIDQIQFFTDLKTIFKTLHFENEIQIL